MTDPLVCRCDHYWSDHQVPRRGSNFATFCTICGVDCSADPAALTDEELAKMEAMALDQIGWHPSKRDVPRLIAALRASRAENAQLRETLAFYAGSDDPKEGP